MQFVLFFTLNVYIFNPKKKIIMQIIDTRITTLEKNNLWVFYKQHEFHEKYVLIFFFNYSFYDSKYLNEKATQ